MMDVKKFELILQQCLRLLHEETIVDNNKWFTTHKISSYSLRNDKAIEVLHISNYMLQKIIINSPPLNPSYQLLSHIIQYYKKDGKCFEYCRFIKHFSQWDYQFQFLYKVIQEKQLHHIRLYLKVRQNILKCSINKTHKQLLSSIQTQIEQWANLVCHIFRNVPQEKLLNQYATVMKNHYVQVKKNQNDRVNGAEFFRICQMICVDIIEDQFEEVNKDNRIINSNNQKSSQISQYLLTGLKMEDKELIRMLSFKDKNVAMMLQRKHQRIVKLITDEVQKLRKDIQNEQQKHIELNELHKKILKESNKINELSLTYLLKNNQQNEDKLILEINKFNKRYNPKNKSAQEVKSIIKQKRLISIIQKQENLDQQFIFQHNNKQL